MKKVKMREIPWDVLVRPGGVIIEPLGSGIFRLSESVLSLDERSYFYLVHGDESSCMIDGGWGFCVNLLDCLPDETKNLIAIATHSHYDHIGHLGVATRRFGHREEAHIFRDPTIEATQASPFLAGRPCLADGNSIDARSMRQHSCPLTDLVDEGDVIDLGARVLRVLHTPGHSPGSISLFDEATSTVFCGDVLLEGDIYDDIPGADRDVLLTSHDRLSSLPFDRLLPGHGPAMDKSAVLTRMLRYRGAAASR
jgi:glyoxylase-like metal-dependent hydrolase (beta-lactamase superfamily II)